MNVIYYYDFFSNSSHRRCIHNRPSEIIVMLTIRKKYSLVYYMYLQHFELEYHRCV